MMLDARESEVKSYCRTYTATFESAQGSIIRDRAGREFIDFLSGCSSLNYGHNPPAINNAMVEYISKGGVMHSLDMMTVAKEAFIDALYDVVLTPRGMKYRVQFPGPTGTNAVEAAIKLSRKFTGRTNVIAFTNGFHGCTLGALSLTANKHNRGSVSTVTSGVTRWPYDGYYGPGADTADMLDAILTDPSGGLDAPAAIIFETVQGEGGLNFASREWMQRMCQVGRAHGALIIVDDIQAGCGRSGDFFSFDEYGIVPDIVVLAKSLSGNGLPLSLVLLKEEIDVWSPGEHNGTFRGNNLAFVSATAAFDEYWRNRTISEVVKKNERRIDDWILEICQRFPVQPRGRNMFRGIRFDSAEVAYNVRRDCYANGLIIETCGPSDEVLKFLPPLNIEEHQLKQGLAIVADAIELQMDRVNRQAVAAE